MDLLNGLDSIKVVNTRIKTDLIQNHNPRLTRLLIQRAQSRGDVARGDNVRLALDGGLNDGGVVGVGNEGDDEVVGGHSLLKSGSIVDVQRDGGRVGKVGSEGLGGLEGAAG